MPVVDFVTSAPLFPTVASGFCRVDYAFLGGYLNFNRDHGFYTIRGLVWCPAPIRRSAVLSLVI